MKKNLFILSFIFLIFSYLYGQKAPKNVILLIGDGMGPVQVEALSYLKSRKPAVMTQFPYHGISNTNNLRDSITDSAAGGSALSTGKKTLNGHVATDENGHPNENIVEWVSRENNMGTGIIVTSHITDATPAAFYAHVNSRKEHEEIARQLVFSDLDFVAGGYLNYFLPEERKDHLNLLDSLDIRGFTLNTSITEMNNAVAAKPFVMLSEKYPPKASERESWLQNCMYNAFDCLTRHTNGFFLMVEGSQIDWACHDNDFDHFADEILEFDKAVQIAYEFAMANDETLVVVTADHETGGMSLDPAIKKVKKKLVSQEVGKYVTWETKRHTGKPVNVYAFGPGAELFQGKMENTDIYLKIKNLLTRKH